MTESELHRIFNLAVDLPPEERMTVIQRETDNPTVIAELVALLEEHDRTQDLFDSPLSERYSGILNLEGRRLDEFQLVRELGRGGMGVVYLARDTDLNRDVAIKVLHAEHLGSEYAVGKLRSEARIVAKLSHPGIVSVYRAGSADGLNYIAMKFIDGGTYADWLQKDADLEAEPTRRRSDRVDRTAWISKAKLRRAVAMIADAASAIHFAHGKGVVHRDIKPTNILVDQERNVSVTDFGIAIAGQEHSTSQTVELIGTPHYMSPEQANAVGKGLGPSSDIFSLGVVLYETLTAERPFDGDTMPRILESICKDAPIPPRAINRAIDRELELVCFKSLEKHPDDRYESAEALSLDLTRWLRGDPVHARPASIVRRTRHLLKKRPTTITAAVAGVLLVVVALVGVQRAAAAGDARVYVTAEGTSHATVFATRIDTSESRAPRRLGTTPLRSRLEPGRYLFVVEADDGRFAEGSRDLLASTETPVAFPMVHVDFTTMALIPANHYAVSDLSEKSGGTTRSEQWVDAFFIDRDEVTNREYKRFVDAIGDDDMLPLPWRSTGYDHALADHPVSGVRHQWMTAYAEWVGKRLPTSAEWEAARQYAGPDNEGRRVIDGLRPDQHTLDTLIDEYRRWSVPIPLGTPERRSALSTSFFDGNVREATSTHLGFPATAIVTKGASFASSAGESGPWVTVLMPPTGTSEPRLGFRCARSLQPPIKE